MTMKTIGEAYLSDPRIEKAKNLISEALAEHSSKISKVSPPHKDLKQNYDEVLKKFAKDRGGNLFYNYLGTGIGNGSLVELADGSVKYDFITGIGVHYFGHSNDGVIRAQIDGAISDTTMCGNLQQNIDSPKLFELILKEANKNGAGLDHLFLTSSGVMTAENSLKMAFQKNHPAHRVLAFEKCFMGRTLSVSQITDKALYRDGLPEALSVDYLPFYDYKDHQGSIDKAVNLLNKYLTRHPGQYAAICMELIQGEGGYWPGHKDFFKAIIDVCKKNKIAVIVDEVQTFMRTKNMFAFQYFELDQEVDFVNIGKNSQVCATIYRKEYAPRPGLISQTFTSSASAIHAAYYMINEVATNGYLGKDGKIEKLHEYFTAKLDQLSKKHPEKIEGPWGVGVMIGMTIFKGDAQKSKDFTLRLFENGVLSFIAGSAPTRVRFLVPAGVATTTDIDNVCAIIVKTLTEMT